MVLTHQHVDEGSAHVMAHALGPAHKGQRLGSIGLVADAVVMKEDCAPRQRDVL